MAPISKLIPFLFLATLLLSFQVNARDSQFFSKVSPSNTNTNNLRETEATNNEGPLNKPEQQQQPAFIPETENSYGLYGHESGLNPPTTTTNYQPYKTMSAEDTSKYSNNNNYNSKKDAYTTNQHEMSETRLTGSYSSNNNYYYKNKDAFGGKQNELSDTKYTEGGYNENQNNNDNKYFYNNNNDNAAKDKYFYNNNNANDRYFYNNNNNAANEKYSYKNYAVDNSYNGERQGLSDTRFVEGGKYFYDVQSEKYNHPTLHDGSSRGVNSENWYNNRGYFGNNNVNSMQGYQNQEEFEDDQENFEP
ncbi:protein E6-like [Abrus precatorius]|uniref:Protein E6-like n=1 Tax=Abrus precatorius TaxID=3816 RepID=A0A8B8KV33_ABRPR|nr:protein E6-like [Abrus precatorius]